jgi:DNA repair exonuclease SbcCD ATPase subunit
MSEDTTPVETPDAPNEAAEDKTEDQRVPYERFQQANKKAKAETEARKALERTVADLQAQMEERENAGLPELDQMRKRLEQAEKRAEENERKAQEADTKLARSTKERWLTAAAKDFDDPADALAFIDIDDIEDEKDAERAVKRLATKKPRLLKDTEPALPGRVLQNGRPAQQDLPAGMDPGDLAQMQALSEGLKQFASRD